MSQSHFPWSMDSVVAAISIGVTMAEKLDGTPRGADADHLSFHPLSPLPSPSSVIAPPTFHPFPIGLFCPSDFKFKKYSGSGKRCRLHKKCPAIKTTASCKRWRGTINTLGPTISRTRPAGPVEWLAVPSASVSSLKITQGVPDNSPRSKFATPRFRLGLEGLVYISLCLSVASVIGRV